MTEEKTYTLIVKYLTKESSTEEEKDLLAWLSQSEENRKIFRSFKDAYDLGQFENHLKGSDTTAEWKKLLRRMKPAAKPVITFNPFRKVLRYAAIFVLGLLCMKVIDMFFVKKQPAAVNAFITRVETGKGERSKVTLPDSTVVWLNACSSISYDHDFGNQTRKIHIKGELFFDVRKDISKPFLVCTDNLNYRVTGTSFNVYSFDNDDIESLILVDGTVTLELGNYKTEVKPGEHIEFNKTARKISRHQTNVAIYTGWRFGELMFEKMTFEELAKRLERNFNITFVFENEKVKKESFGGTFRHYDSLETILKVISISTPIKYKIEKDTIYIR
jgi:ferric-dicitrate binding protein FerR (iron transport regulator)